MIPFLDLKRGHEKLKKEIDEALERVIYKNSYFVLGPEMGAFEEEFAKFCGSKYGVGVNSGTDALELAMRAVGVKEGDEVIVPVNTAIPTAMAILSTGATPVFVDVGEDYLIDSNKIKAIITPKTKAIIPVHLYGQACEMDTLLRIAKEHNLEIIEDACQAHGAMYKGKRVPIGDIGCFSFYPSKNLGALGDGGMVVTDNLGISKKVKLLRNYGQIDKYNAEIIGGNSRLDDLQAAILIVKLRDLENGNTLRVKHAGQYQNKLKDVNNIKLPINNSGSESVYHLYVVRTNDRDGLKNYLDGKGIGNLIHYPLPLHLQKAFLGLGYKEGDFPNAERFAKEIISLPMFPELKPSEVDVVCDAVIDYFKK